MNSSLLSRALVLLGFGVALLLPSSAFAGTCVNFCRGVAPRVNGSIMVTASDAPTSCTRATDCRGESTCSGQFGRATDQDIREFCSIENLQLLSTTERASAGWCAGYLGGEGATLPVRHDGRCRINAPSISATPAPDPVTIGDSHRCRFLCAGDQQARDGGVCVGPEDRSTCIRGCVQACGANNCLGVVEGGQPSREYPQQVPQCIPTRVDQSVGGISDTHRFESINEVFGNISITAFIGAVVKTLIGFAGALFLLMLLWAGFRWTTSGGEQAGVTAAQTTLRNAVIGIIVVATSYVLVTAIIELIGRATAVTP